MKLILALPLIAANYTLNREVRIDILGVGEPSPI
jgi:hypothetical protein